MTAKTLVLLLAAVAALSACNTMSGAGKDVSAAGSAVTDGAQDVQKKM
jgi:predicted small secreted protein